MQTVPCLPCCTDTQTVNVPGPQGPAGTAGTSPPAPPPPDEPVSAYSTLNANTLVPAIGSNQSFAVTASDGSSGGAIWMAVGQVVVFDGPAHFRVVSVGAGDATFVGTFLGYSGDVAGGSTISAGAVVSPSGTQPDIARLSAIASGSVYSLTATSALLNFGTADPSLTITSPGTWLILGRARFDYAGATFADERTVSLKVRRTNNTAADASPVAVFPTSIITTQTHPAWDLQTPPTLYTTLNSNDILELWGDVSVLPTAGTIDATAAQLIAIKLAS